jgi:FxsC-like protein
VPPCFLSYARADADPYFNGFVTDFVNELRAQLGETDSAGLMFRDTKDIPLGAKWEPELEHALRTCRVFLAMLSPTYIRRPRCSKEWAYFEWRLGATGTDGPPHRLVTLEWVPIPPDDRPPAVQARQFKHDALGTGYAVHGLRYLVQHGGSPYMTFLTALARVVRDLIRGTALPEPPAEPAGRTPDGRQLTGLAALRDPFSLAAPVAPAAGAAAGPVAPAAAAAAAIGGPKHVEFIVVAARQDELAAIRNGLAAWGVDVTEWCPYRPADDTSAIVMMQTVATTERMSSAPRAAPPSVVDLLREARASNTLVVLVVDVWSLELPAYRTVMWSLDGAERFPNAGVLVVWNLDDHETTGRQDQLGWALRVSFPTLMVMKDPLVFHDQLGTPAQLTDKLRATLHELKRRIADFGDVMRMARGPAPIAKPLLIGPGEPPPAQPPPEAPRPGEPR